ncbi:MAG: dihydrodipicolinate synthase family protein [Planctomycetales bacterium]|nr:dihydrodipicolinate synthase family protein [Planctomycetales bacterium]
MSSKIRGLIAAPHTPFTSDGNLNLDMVDKQAAHFERTGVVGVFVGGTTGESLSLSHTERIQLIERWGAIGRNHNLRVIAHVGGNAVPEARELAKKSEDANVDGIAAMAPCFFRSASVANLVEFTRLIAEPAGSTPFYFYHIPSMTHVELPMVPYMETASKQIPTFAGLKFTHSDLCEELECASFEGGKYDVLHGFDETLVGGMAVGVRAAVGSTYNYAAPLYNTLMKAVENGDAETARSLQQKSAAMVRVIQRHGFMAGSKAIMSFFGVDCGPVRRPLESLLPAGIDALRADLETLGFFDWVAV